MPSASRLISTTMPHTHIENANYKKILYSMVFSEVVECMALF